MKKIILALALALPLFANAQKYGHVNGQEVLGQMPEIKQVEARLDSLNKQYENMLMAMQDEYQKKLTDYQQKKETMTEAMRQIQEDDLMAMQQRLQTTYQTAEQDVQQKQQEYMAPVQQKLMDAIKAVGEENKYTYIYNSAAMLYIAPDADDVTPLVKKKLGIK